MPTAKAQRVLRRRLASSSASSRPSGATQTHSNRRAISKAETIMRSSSPRTRPVGLCAVLVALFAVAGSLDGATQCQQRVAMATYSICFPAGWRIEREPEAERVIACYGIKRCATAWGDPVRGVGFLVVLPADKIVSDRRYSSPYDLVANQPHPGSLPLPQKLGLKSQPGQPRKTCFFRRELVTWAGAWEELYGLEVNERLFEAWTRYEDDPKQLDAYRAAIRSIVSSITPR